jgi:hypothetical protein
MRDKNRRGACPFCNTFRDFLVRDHIVPRFKAKNYPELVPLGLNHNSNIQYICDNCHADKSRKESSEASSAHHSSLTKEERSEVARRRWSKFCPEERSEIVRERQNTTSKEKRSAFNSQRMLKMYASKTPEERREIYRKRMVSRRSTEDSFNLSSLPGATQCK